MYKLLLVTDQEEVLSSFEAIQDWERNGFKKPHIRHDFEGAKESLFKHHADAVAFEVNEEEKEKLIAYLDEHYPRLSIFRAGKTREEAARYLQELRSTLNKLRADYSNEVSSEEELMLEMRHDVFRHLLSGAIHDEDQLYRSMRLLRSRMDTYRPCIVIEMEQPEYNREHFGGGWGKNYRQLERTLQNSFTRDVDGYHMVPLVTETGKIYLLAGALHGQRQPEAEQLMVTILRNSRDGIEHVGQYQGIELNIVNIRTMPSLNALCE